jgi:hypothetical protein
MRPLAAARRRHLAGVELAGNGIVAGIAGRLYLRMIGATLAAN